MLMMEHSRPGSSSNVVDRAISHQKTDSRKSEAGSMMRTVERRGWLTVSPIGNATQLVKVRDHYIRDTTRVDGRRYMRRMRCEWRDAARGLYVP